MEQNIFINTVVALNQVCKINVNIHKDALVPKIGNIGLWGGGLIFYTTILLLELLRTVSVKLCFCVHVWLLCHLMFHFVNIFASFGFSSHIDPSSSFSSSYPPVPHFLPISSVFIHYADWFFVHWPIAAYALSSLFAPLTVFLCTKPTIVLNKLF